MMARAGWWRNGVGALALALAVAGSAGGVALAPAAQSQELPSVADLADRLLPAVVEITVETHGGDGGPAAQAPDIPDNSPFKDFFDDFFKNHQNPSEAPRTMTSMGSGFVIDATGLIVTNNHVVEGADTIEVRFQDGDTLKAELVGRDPKTDLAVLRVKPVDALPTVNFGDSDHLRIGEWVMAIGNPFGFGGSVSLGIVSARNRDISAGPYDDFIQTDAAINKGNSGGPLFNLKGEVVGINTAIISPTGGSVGIGFAVPSNNAKGVVNQLIKFGETRRGWLGVKIQSVSGDIAESMGMKHAHGALIADLPGDGPAALAGIQPGDVVIEFNGRVVGQMRDLPRYVAEAEVGARVPVKILRKGVELTLTVEVGRLQDGDKVVAESGGSSPNGTAPAAPAVVTALGMTVSSLTDDLRAKYATEDGIAGAVVTEVAGEGAASDKGLAPGDIITEAGEQPVTGAADISARIEEATKAGKTSILLLVAKGGKQAEMRFIALKLKK